MMKPSGGGDQPARCATCGKDTETENERRSHEEKTGHRVWRFLARGPHDSPALSTRG